MTPQTTLSIRFSVRWIAERSPNTEPFLVSVSRTLVSFSAMKFTSPRSSTYRSCVLSPRRYTQPPPVTVSGLSTQHMSA